MGKYSTYCIISSWVSRKFCSQWWARKCHYCCRLASTRQLVSILANSLPGPPSGAIVSAKGMTINDRGAEEILEINLFFPGNPFRIIFFPLQGLSKIFFLGKASQNFFFSCRGVFKIFLKSASQNLFFPGECLSKFFFSRFPPAPLPDH